MSFNNEIKTSTETIQYTNPTHKYELCDIIDFLEPEYINDWLNFIPNDVWIKYKKNILKEIYKLKNDKIIQFLIKKINFDLVKYVITNFDKITLELLKFCVEHDFEKLKKQLIKPNTFEIVIHHCMLNDYEFNKYFYETIYLKLNQTELPQLQPINSLILKKHIISPNVFISSIVKSICRYSIFIKNYETLMYYDSKFDIKTYLKQHFFNTICFTSAKVHYNTFGITMRQICIDSKINNLNDLINIKNILINNDETYEYNLMMSLKYICKNTNTNEFIKIINSLKTIFLSKKNTIITIMSSAILSNTHDVFLIYKHLIDEKKCIIDENIFDGIIYTINQSNKKGDYDKTIYEFINLGIKTSIKPYYHYANRLKIIK